MLARIFLLIISVGFILGLRAQAPTGLSPELKVLNDELENCLRVNPDSCQLIEEKIETYLREFPVDTTAARYAFGIVQTRELVGVWDETTEDLIRLSIALEQKGNNPCGAAYAQLWLTRFALFQSDPQETLTRAERGLEMAEACGETKHIAHAYSFIGAAQIEQAAYRKALENLIESERLYLTTDDQMGLAMVKLDLAVAYMELDDRPKSQQLSWEAAKIYQEQGEELRYAVAIIDLCNDYLATDQLDSVDIYLPQAEDIVRDQHPLALAYVYQHYGQLHLKRENYGEAVNNLEKSLEINEGIGHLDLEINNLIFLGRTHLATGQYRLAHRQAIWAEGKAATLGITFLRLQALSLLAETAHQIGAYQLSFYTHKQYIHWSDSLRGADRLQEITLLEQTFEAEKREIEIKRQEEENQLLTDKNRALNMRNGALIAALFLLGVAGYAIFLRQRMRAQQQEALLRVKALENESLNQKLEFKNRELTARALQIAQKNELLNSLQSDIEAHRAQHGNTMAMSKLSSKIRFESLIDENWEQFTRQFTEMNPAFYQILNERHPGLTQNDLRLATLLRMNLASKEIAHILNISDEAVKKARYRLRKKLGLATSDKLENYVLAVG
ncbi:MAG: hypothetical protein AAFO03_13955 [Bacteroidota bacterium]